MIPGRSGKITRVCSEERFFFAWGAHEKGDRETNAQELRNLVGYCLGIALRGLSFQIHAMVVMSNHVHIDYTDPLGESPIFKQRFFSHLGKSRNVQLKRFGSVWNAKSCDTDRVASGSEVRDLVYTLTNPVKDGLVKWARLWPGFTTYGWAFGETRSFRRPEVYFDPEGDLPEEVEVVLTRPPALEAMTDEEATAYLNHEVRVEEQRQQAEMKAKKRRFAGVEKLNRYRWNQSTAVNKARFHQKPEIGVGKKWEVLAAIQRNREWEREYVLARAPFEAGKPGPDFPYGSYWLPRFAGAKVAAAPP